MGTGWKLPRMASQAPTGATPRARPRTTWESAVKRFVYEYPKTITSASGDRARHSGFSIPAASTSAPAETRTNPPTSPRESTPFGSSRPAVRGFRASIA